MDRPVEGETNSYERTFTPAEVRQFGELTGDDQPRHTQPDEDGRVMVQGLLTATMPTKLGGDDEVLARRMDFEFHRPVYTGESVTCESRTEAVVEREDRYDITTEVVCSNAEGETVLTATIEGLVWKEDFDGH
jgi:acyl dehydratase